MIRVETIIKSIVKHGFKQTARKCGEDLLIASAKIAQNDLAGLFEKYRGLRSQNNKQASVPRPAPHKNKHDSPLHTLARPHKKPIIIEGEIVS